MSRTPLQLAVILGSTREGRFGPVATSWFTARAEQHGDFAVDLIDLADEQLPPVYPAEPDPDVQAYLKRLDDADAFVVVTPEYNHGYPAALKQAIDLGRSEWHAKPVGFVSYGGMAGGLRAVEQLRQVFAEVHAPTVRDGVSFANFWDLFDQDTGEPRDPAGCNIAAKTMLDQLAWWAAALREARLKTPYAA